MVEQVFAGKKVLVTGASQGIGEVTAQYFAERGAQVAINARNVKKLEAVLASLKPVSGGKHVMVPGDLSSEEVINSLMDKAIKELDGLDILICNAGFQIACPSDQIKMDDFWSVMQVNVGGVVATCRQAIQYWLKHNIKGSIVVNSSVHQIIPKPDYLGYSASKGAVGNVVRTLALEYASRGIRVNAVAPGAIVTPINDAWVNDAKKRQEVCDHIPMDRPGESIEIAESIGFLAGDKSMYTTGQTLFVDGGLTLYADFAKNWSS